MSAVDAGGTAADGAGGTAPIGRWLALAAGVIALDQASKWATVGAFQLGEGLAVTAWFNLVRVHNPGAAFSFLAGAGGWQRWFFSGLGLLVSAYIVWMLRQPGQSRTMCTALSLVLGGALGNVIDRFVHGHVIDMLDVHGPLFAGFFPGGHFPAFNLADSALTLGAILLIADELRRWRRGG